MTLRDKRQVEFATKWLETKFGILYLCPRFGKIMTSLYCMNFVQPKKILIIHPIETIKKSWEDDLVKWDYAKYLDKITFTTTASLWKVAEAKEQFDLIIADEVHLFSPANLQELSALIDSGNKCVLGLSGTISGQTAYNIRQTTGLPIVAEYDIETGIKEKVITDYEITVVMTKLDDVQKYIQPSKTKQFFLTEHRRYTWLTEKIDAIRAEDELVKDKIRGGDISIAWPNTADNLGLLPLHRMLVLKKSLAKLEMTKKLLRQTKGRVLVFCGTIETAEKLGIPTYHSKNKDQAVKDAFCSGEGDALATVDMFEAGVTIKPINLAIINSFDSNPENLTQRISRLTGMEYDTPTKVARVYIICTNTVEREWLDKALEFFDLTKVNYI